MTDRALLEAAALAFGLYNCDPRGDDDLWETKATDEDGHPKEPAWGMRTIGDVWNPLTDDGDALRLAVKLNLQITIEDERCGAVTVAWGDEFSEYITELSESPDTAAAATRRAIVRAAATLGNQI